MNVDPRYLPRLIELLSNSNSDIRRMAAVSIGSLGSAADKAITHLMKAMNDEEYWVAEDAAFALNSIGDKAIGRLNKKHNLKYLRLYEELLP